MDLELDSDLTFRNGDNKVELGLLLWGLGMGMGDLDGPPVSVGFSDEVALSRSGSNAGLDATTVAGGGAGGS